MKTNSLLILVALLTLLASSSRVGAQGTTFTYQGRLTDNGTPVNGLYDLQLALYDALANGNQIGQTLNKDEVPVTDGIFTVTLDFGAEVFGGAARWLEIRVRPGDSAGDYTFLSPRQELTPAPYALHAASFKGAVLDSQLSALIPRLNANQTFTGVATFSPALGPPFLVGNSSKVNNLNADLLDGLDSSAFLLKTEHCLRTIAELKAQMAGFVPCVSVLGYHAPGDGGGGDFYWDAEATELDNGGTILRPNSLPATGRWKRPWSSTVRGEWFGARFDGETDDTSALRNAIAAMTLVPSGHAGGVGSGTRPRLVLPARAARITGDLSNGNALGYMHIQGDKTIFRADDGITTFGNLFTMVTIEGVIVRGGAKAFAIATGNIDTAIINIDNCECHGQTTASIDIDATSQSTQLNVSRSKLYGGAKIINALSCDYINVDNCWVAPGGPVAFDVTDVNLTLRNMLGVPTEGMTAWIDARGKSRIYVDSSTRFGGESVPTYIVRAYNSADTTEPVAPTVIDLRASQCSSRYLVGFYAIPNMVTIDAASNAAPSVPFYFDASIPSADLNAIGGEDWTLRINGTIKQMAPFAASTASVPAKAQLGVPLSQHYNYNSAIPNTADLLRQWAGSSGTYTENIVDSPAVTVANITDEFAIAGRQFTATANDASFSHLYTDCLSGLGAGIYTAVFNFEVTSAHVIWPRFYAGNTLRRDQALARGKHTVCIPFYYDGVSPTSVAISVLNMPNGAVVQTHRWRIYAGVRDIAEQRAILLGTAAPTTGEFFRGDEIINANRAGRGVERWQCITAGTPGAWVANQSGGTFVMAAAATKIVNDPSVKATSLIVLMPTNASAGTLMGAATSLYVSARTPDASFTVATANGAVAVGNETFEYMVFN